MGQANMVGNRNSNDSYKVGDLQFTTRDTLGDKWALCNGEPVPEGSDYRPESKLDPMDLSYWGDAYAFKGPTIDFYATTYGSTVVLPYVVYAGDGWYYYIFIHNRSNSGNSVRVDIYGHNIYTDELVDALLGSGLVHDIVNDIVIYTVSISNKNTINIAYGTTNKDDIYIETFAINEDHTVVFSGLKYSATGIGEKTYYAYMMHSVFISSDGTIFVCLGDVKFDDRVDYTIMTSDDLDLYLSYQESGTAYANYIQCYTGNERIDLYMREVDNSIYLFESMYTTKNTEYAVRVYILGTKNEFERRYGLAGSSDGNYYYLLDQNSITINEYGAAVYMVNDAGLAGNKCASKFVKSFYDPSDKIESSDYTKSAISFQYDGNTYIIDPTLGNVYDIDTGKHIAGFDSCKFMCVDDFYKTKYMPYITGDGSWACLYEAPRLPTVSIDDESYCFIKIKV